MERKEQKTSLYLSQMGEAERLTIRQFNIAKQSARVQRFSSDPPGVLKETAASGHSPFLVHLSFPFNAR